MLLIDLDLPVLKNVKKQLQENNNIAFITKQNSVGVWAHDVLPDAPIFKYAELDNGRSFCCPAEVWLSVVNDHQTWLLLDRIKFGKTYFSSHHNKINRIISMASEAYGIIKNNRITDYFNQVTPHSLEEWVFAKTADATGVNIWYIQETPINWRFALYKGLVRNPDRIWICCDDGDGDRWAIEEYIKDKRSTRDLALPFYEKNRLADNGNKYYNIWKDIKNSWRRPDLVINKLLRYRQYNNYVCRVSLKKPFFIYFLHFQPERTSLPEGYGFASQLGAILTLRGALPANIVLLVKEHPSIFTGTCSIKFRDQYFYKTIHEIPGVEFVPVEEDSYALIDSAVGIGTITGTVATEALLRNVPTVMLGAGHSVDFHHSAFHRYSDQDSLSQFLDRLGEEKYEGDLSIKYSEYMRDLIKNTASGFDDTVIHDTHSYLETRSRAQSIIFSKWLELLSNNI